MDSDSQLSASDAELITRVRGGDRAAFGELYERHHIAAAGVARQYARATSEADDLVAESFAKVLDALLAGRGPDTAFRAYLFTTIRHTAFDRTRKDARLLFTDDIAAHETPEIPVDPVLAGAESSLVARAFTSLPERWQTVLWHTEVEQESPQRVGVLLGLSANAVTSLAFRAREGLRQAYLQAHLADTAARECRTTVARLGAWTRGSLSRRERSEVEAHLSECERCRALAAELEEMNTSLRAVLAPVLLGGAALGYLAATPPVETAAAVGAGAASVAASGGASGVASGAVAATSPWWASGFAIATAAGGIVIAVVAGIIVFTGGGDTAAPPSMTPPVTAASSSHSSPSNASTPTRNMPEPLPPPGETTAETTAETATSEPPAPTSAAPDSPAAETATAGTTAAEGAVIPAASPTAASTAPTTTAKSTKPTPPTTPAKTSPPSTGSVAPSPASLTAPQLSAAAISAPAGGSATVSFAVTNGGETDSGLETLTIAPPQGVDLAGTSMSMTGAFRSSAAAFAGPGAHQRTADPVFTCVSGSCTFLVPALSTMTVTLLFTVDATASSGTIDLSTAAGSASIALDVRIAVLSLTLGTADTRFPSGGVVESAPLVGILAEGVGLAPPVTFPRTVGGLTFTPVSGTCTSTRTTITCAAGKPGRGYYGDLRITIADGAIGPQPITAMIGAAAVAITAAGGAPVTVTRPLVAGSGS